MIELTDLPAVNAILNSVAFGLLIAGYVMIKRGRRIAHKRFMIAAFVVSILFLSSYLTYRYRSQHPRGRRSHDIDQRNGAHFLPKHIEHLVH